VTEALASFLNLNPQQCHGECRLSGRFSDAERARKTGPVSQRCEGDRGIGYRLELRKGINRRWLWPDIEDRSVAQRVRI